jgi:ABC-type polysaccharide transport system permease subunit
MVMPSIIVMSVWKNLGYYVVLYIAGLTTIPPELNEAAWIDGASRLQSWRHICLPLYPSLTDSDADYVIDSVGTVLAELGATVADPA